MQQPELGHRIATLRRKHNYTQETLAEKLGINCRSLQRLEAGETNCPSHLMDRIEFMQLYSIHIDDEDHLIVATQIVERTFFDSRLDVQ